jgi:hypothetical protein
MALNRTNRVAAPTKRRDGDSLRWQIRCNQDVRRVLEMLGAGGGLEMTAAASELLDMARDVAAFNLPARVGHLFGVIL